MAEFVIKLADDRGRMLEQTQAAATAEELRARFTQAGYHVFSVKPKGLSLPGLGSGRRKKVKLETFLVFNQQFLTLIRAGITILNAMDLLARRQKDLSFQAQLIDAAQRVRNGESVSSAFEAQETFPLIYVTTLMAGEKSGNLEEVLGRYLAFQRITLTFTKKLKASLIYPALLVTLVCGLFLFLIGFVVPRFAQLYDQIGTKLPTLTIIMLEMGNGIQHYTLYALPVLAILVFLIYRWVKTERGAALVDRVRVRLPIFGDIWLKYQVALFARTLSMLLQGGLPLVPSLNTAAKSMGSRSVSSAVAKSVISVSEGRGLSRSLEETKIFPELSVEMIEVGESSGALPQMLNSVSEFYEEDVQTALTAALSLIEPAILMVMGVVVIVILISLYLPIFSLSSGSGFGGH
jgi:type IV pilus assembly protein PilC